ncbi:hypothetical protein BC940DRAFT_368320 [Gongronella butleri]|nr:hypothetical protein BC940DRAFT_368320 [Gongronella butleri]
MRKKETTLFSSLRGKQHSVYLGFLVFNGSSSGSGRCPLHEAPIDPYVLLTRHQQLPMVPLFTRDRAAFQALTLASPEFLSMLKWTQGHDVAPSDDDQWLLSRFIDAHGRLLQQMLGGSSNSGDLSMNSRYRGTLYRRPINLAHIKLLVVLFPFDKLQAMLPHPLSRASRLHWYPFTLPNASNSSVPNPAITAASPIAPATSSSKSLPTEKEKKAPKAKKTKKKRFGKGLSVPLWSPPREPSVIDASYESSLAPGLYLALFYPQASPGMRTIQLYLERHKEHRLPCVRVRDDTALSHDEWAWLQTLRSTYRESAALDTKDFLTQDHHHQHHHKHQHQQRLLAPFKCDMEHARQRLSTWTGIHLQLSHLYAEDCFIDKDASPEMVAKAIQAHQLQQQQQQQQQQQRPFLCAKHAAEASSNTTQPPPRRLSLADMMAAAPSHHVGWSQRVRVRILVLVYPLTVTPHFPTRPDFDFYPGHLFDALHPYQFIFHGAQSSMPPTSIHRHHDDEETDLLFSRRASVIVANPPTIHLHASQNKKKIHPSPLPPPGPRTNPLPASLRKLLQYDQRRAPPMPPLPSLSSSNAHRMSMPPHLAPPAPPNVSSTTTTATRRPRPPSCPPPRTTAHASSSSSSSSSDRSSDTISIDASRRRSMVVPLKSWWAQHRPSISTKRRSLMV